MEINIRIQECDMEKGETVPDTIVRLFGNATMQSHIGAEDLSNVHFQTSTPDADQHGEGNDPEPQATPEPPQTSEPVGTPEPPEQDAPVDEHGVPWDGRVHSSNGKISKTGKRAGRWQKKRGVDDAEVERVEAELMASSAGPMAEPENGSQQAAPAGAPMAEPENGGQQAAPPPMPGGDNAAQQPQQPQGPAPGNPTQPAGSTTRWTFPTFLRAHQAAVDKGQYTHEDLIAYLQAQYNIDKLPLLASQPGLIPEIAESMGLEAPAEG